MKPQTHKLLAAAAIAILCFVGMVRAQSDPNGTHLITIDASRLAISPPASDFYMGGKSPSGHEVGVNRRFLTLDGKPWLPVMGEFHFSRYPEKYWEEELLKMKAAGIEVVTTYVFWIHHEEIKGQFDWSGQRDLHRFVALCAKHGMKAFVRIGPWAHGEARNGGFPDWVVKQGPVRKNDPIYLESVQRFYGEIGKQLKGLLWKDGGPVIGIQIENEYTDRGPGAGAAHISALKKIALASGLDVPIYTVTGWSNTDFPAGEVLPVFGAYPDAFWEGSRTELPPNLAYLFDTQRDLFAEVPAGIAAAQIPSVSTYPYLVAEGGGGMAVAYHRRPVIQPDDTPPVTLTRLGSGANLYGYYMFHGGANPPGKLTTLQESYATDYPNDLPELSYDFQAPLGEFGQVHGSLRKLKLIHLFLNDFGSYLAPMEAVLPDAKPAGPEDLATPRAAVRSDGKGAFLFFNNYVRGYGLPERKGIQVAIKLPSETVLVPQEPVNIPAEAYFVWPINLELDDAVLKYSTAQLLSRVDKENVPYYFFFAVRGMPSEFVFDERSVRSIEAPKATTERADGRIHVKDIPAGLDVAITVHSRSGKTVRIILLTDTEAQNTWKSSIGSSEYIFVSPADLFFVNDSAHLRARNVDDLRFSVFPPLHEKLLKSTVNLTKTGSEGIFDGYLASMPAKALSVRWNLLREAGPVPLPIMAKQVPWRKNPVPIVPSDTDFEKAAIWQISRPKKLLDGLSDAFLRIHYTGDIGRLYAGKRLLDDDFYKGTVWEIGLKRFDLGTDQPSFTVEVLPLRRDTPIYVPASAWPSSGQQAAAIQKMELIPEYEVVVSATTGETH